jgi:hypothetical protein
MADSREREDKCQGPGMAWSDLFLEYWGPFRRKGAVLRLKRLNSLMVIFVGCTCGHRH